MFNIFSIKTRYNALPQPYKETALRVELFTSTDFVTCCCRQGCNCAYCCSPSEAEVDFFCHCRHFSFTKASVNLSCSGVSTPNQPGIPILCAFTCRFSLIASSIRSVRKYSFALVSLNFLIERSSQSRRKR